MSEVKKTTTLSSLTKQGHGFALQAVGSAWSFPRPREMPLGCLVFTSPSDRMGWDPKQVVLCLSPFAWARRRGSAPNYPQFPKQGLLLGGAGATLSLGYDLIPLPVGSRVSLHTQDRLSSEDQLCRPLCYCTIRPCSFQKSSRALSQCVGL